MAQRRGSTDQELSAATRDVVTGMLLSNLIMYFIILTTAATLNANGMKNIETARQAAEALRPLAGKGAYLLFTLGLVGTGMLGVPVLAGSCAYTIAEAARWRGASLNKKFKLARRFYSVIGVSVLVGLALNYVKRREDAVLVSCPKWHPGAATRNPRCVADNRQESNGKPR